MNKRHIRVLLCAAGTIGLTAYGVCALVPRSPLRVLPIAAHDSNHSNSHPEAAGDTPQPRRDIKSYNRAIGESLFTAPQPKPRPAKPVPPPAPPLPVVVPVPPPPDPLADVIYSGSFTIDGRTVALLESRSTKQGDYVQEGDDWRGFRVQAVSPDTLTILVNGAPRTLVKSDAINLVPLSGGAPGSATAGAPGPGAPGGAQSNVQMGGNYRSAATEMLLNMENTYGLKLSADSLNVQAQRQIQEATLADEKASLDVLTSKIQLDSNRNP